MRRNPRTGAPLGSAADRAASGLHSGHRGGNLDLTFGRLGNRYSGFVHIGGQPGNLDVSASVWRHPKRDRGYHDGYYGHYGHRRHHYGYGHYYRDYPVVRYRHHHYYYPTWPCYGYSYHCAYYNDPVYYWLATPSVVYVEVPTTYVEVERDPEVVEVYRDDEVGPPASGETGWGIPSRAFRKQSGATPERLYRTRAWRRTIRPSLMAPNQ